jgi:hypothetical protein
MIDFRDEIPGYTNNLEIVRTLNGLVLKEGVDYIPDNMIRCYETLIAMGLIEKNEMDILHAWLSDIHTYTTQ